MSDEGHLWMENKNIQDESKGGPGDCALRLRVHMRQHVNDLNVHIFA